MLTKTGQQKLWKECCHRPDPRLGGDSTVLGMYPGSCWAPRVDQDCMPR